MASRERGEEEVVRVEHLGPSHFSLFIFLTWVCLITFYFLDLGLSFHFLFLTFTFLSLVCLTFSLSIFPLLLS